MSNFNEEWQRRMLAAGVFAGASNLGEIHKSGRIKWCNASIASLENEVSRALGGTFKASLEREVSWRKGKGKEVMSNGWNEVTEKLQDTYKEMKFDVNKVKEKYKE